MAIEKPPVTPENVEHVRTGETRRVDERFNGRAGTVWRAADGTVYVRCNGSTVVYDRLGHKIRG
jgi:hypothetical protein